MAFTYTFESSSSAKLDHERVGFGFHVRCEFKNTLDTMEMFIKIAAYGVAQAGEPIMEPSIRLHQLKPPRRPHPKTIVNRINVAQSPPSHQLSIIQKLLLCASFPTEKKHLKNFIARERCESLCCVSEAKTSAQTYIMPLGAYRDSFMVTTSPFASPASMIFIAVFSLSRYLAGIKWEDETSMKS
jgi:hypothetical protein